MSGLDTIENEHRSVTGLPVRVRLMGWEGKGFLDCDINYQKATVNSTSPPTVHRKHVGEERWLRIPDVPATPELRAKLNTIFIVRLNVSINDEPECPMVVRQLRYNGQSLAAAQFFEIQVGDFQRASGDWEPPFPKVEKTPEQIAEEEEEENYWTNYDSWYDPDEGKDDDGECEYSEDEGG